MNPILVEFPNHQFYDGQLKSGVSQTDRLLPTSNFPWPKVESKEKGEFVHPICFIQCSSLESPGASKSNHGQAVTVGEVIKKLRTNSQSDTNELSKQKSMQITVLTPYSRQVKELENVIKKYGSVDIFTIDGYQGRESEIIIFSTVRCNNHGAVGFLGEFYVQNSAD